MLAYVCDFCGKVLSSETHKINRKENPYFAIINIDFSANEKQYHACKECFDNFVRDTPIISELNEMVENYQKRS